MPIDYSCVSAILSPALIIAGWIWVKTDTDRREDKRDLRATIDRLRSDIDRVATNSIRWHAMPITEAGYQELQFRIRVDVVYMREELNRMHRKYERINLTPEISQFTRAAARHIDTTAPHPVEGYDVLTSRIISTASNLTLELERAYDTTVGRLSRWQRLTQWRRRHNGDD